VWTYLKFAEASKVADAPCETSKVAEAPCETPVASLVDFLKLVRFLLEWAQELKGPQGLEGRQELYHRRHVWY